jgi:hypothetical protein
LHRIFLFLLTALPAAPLMGNPVLQVTALEAQNMVSSSVGRLMASSRSRGFTAANAAAMFEGSREFLTCQSGAVIKSRGILLIERRSKGYPLSPKTVRTLRQVIWQIFHMGIRKKYCNLPRSRGSGLNCQSPSDLQKRSRTRYQAGTSDVGFIPTDIVLLDVEAPEPIWGNAETPKNGVELVDVGAAASTDNEIFGTRRGCPSQSRDGRGMAGSITRLQRTTEGGTQGEDDAMSEES